MSLRSSSRVPRLSRRERRRRLHRRYRPLVVVDTQPDATPPLRLTAMNRGAAALATWRRRAHHDKQAAYKVACCYRDGVGTPRDPIQAKEWFRVATRMGHIHAMIDLAEYELPPRAMALYHLARRHGVEPPTDKVAEVSLRLRNR